MAKKQTRKSISINRAVYAAVVEVAAAEGVAVSQWITRLIHTAIPGLATHASTPDSDPIRAALKPIHRMDAVAVRALLEGQKPGPRPEPDPRPVPIAGDVLRRQHEYQERALTNPCRREYCRIDGVHPADDARHGRRIAARSNGVG